MPIQSLLDNDLYKFTMQNAVLELFPNAIAEYTFINRGKHKFTEEFAKELVTKIKSLCKLHLTKEEKIWFQETCKYLKPQYFDYLGNYRFDIEDLRIVLYKWNGDMELKISGPWHKTILWEVPLLALISETYFETVDTNWIFDRETYTNILDNKFKLLNDNDCHTSEFGTRRRRSYAVQDLAVETGKKYPIFAGTSNVYLSKKYNLIPRGTMAHEWIMGNSVLEGLRNANYYAHHNWVRVYNADLGIALPDTYGSKVFWGNFNPRLSKLFDGLRQDSGNPYNFTDDAVSHYTKTKIDPLSKIITFTNNLTPEEAVSIKNYCKGKIKASFGIGTKITNDFSYCNSPPLNIVIKMSKMNDVPVVKLSDDEGKTSGDPDAIRVAKWTFYSIPLDRS